MNIKDIFIKNWIEDYNKIYSFEKINRNIYVGCSTGPEFYPKNSIVVKSCLHLIRQCYCYSYLYYSESSDDELEPNEEDSENDSEDSDEEDDYDSESDEDDIQMVEPRCQDKYKID